MISFHSLNKVLMGVVLLSLFWVFHKADELADPVFLSAASFGLLFAIAGYVAIHLKYRLDVLQKEAARFFLIARGTSDGIWDWDFETNEVFFSLRYKELLGYADHEFAPTYESFESRLHPEDRDRVRQEVLAHLEHKAPFESEHRMCAKNGEYRWIHARGQALWSDDGHALRMAGSIRDVTERHQMQESIQESAAVLASAANQLLATTTQLAANASQTAGAVQQTAATTLEIRQSAEVCKQKATEIAQTAKHSVTISHAGDHGVQATLKHIEQVRDQMTAIATRVTQLGEQSQQVSEIIATVEELAEQSNILAVNAAIEAAKAGEKGRGFSVVAQEVKALAEQSQRATAQVKDILFDIQYATTAAISATESGTTLVTAGAEQSSATAGVIRQLAHTIEEAAKESEQIALSNQRQAVGVEQISFAMESIKAASLQNVESVKEMEKVARHLQQLGDRIKEEAGRSSGFHRN